MAKRPNSYPTFYACKKKAWYGEVFDACARVSTDKKVHLGRHRTLEAAQAAFEHWKATGEKPPRKKYEWKRNDRRARVHARKLVGGEIRWDVKGVIQEQGKEPIGVHVGTFELKTHAMEACRVFIHEGAMSKKSGQRVQYPQPSVVSIPLSYGIAYDLRVRTGTHTAIPMGRHRSREAALAAYEHYVKTGEKPARKVREVARSRDERSGHVYQRSTQSGPRWDAKGVICTGNEPQEHVHIGTYETEAEAKAAVDRFVSTGYTPPKRRARSRNGEAKPRRSIPYAQRKAAQGTGTTRGPQAPRVSVSDVQRTIKKGYNLRDHEVAKVPHLVARGCVAKSVEQVRNKELVGLDRNEIWRRLAARAA